MGGYRSERPGRTVGTRPFVALPNPDCTDGEHQKPRTGATGRMRQVASLVDRAASCVGDRNLSPREGDSGNQRRRQIFEVRHVGKPTPTCTACRRVGSPFVFDDSHSFITRAFLRSEFELDYRAYTAEADAELLRRLRDWDGRLHPQRNAGGKAAFTQTFFVDTWGYGESGRVPARGAHDHPQVPRSRRGSQRRRGRSRPRARLVSRTQGRHSAGPLRIQGHSLQA